MRCLIISDIHYSLAQYDWILRVAKNYDLVVLAGDLLDVSAIADIGAQIIVINKYVEKLTEITNVIVCSGNHDLDSCDADGEKVPGWLIDLKRFGAKCDGEAFILENYYFSVCPWWDGPKTREKFFNWMLSESRIINGRKWVWIHHAPPKLSSVSWSGKKSMGDSDLYNLIESYQPFAVISGHIHQSPFVKDGAWVDKIGKSWCFNAGRQIGAPPAFIAIDLDADQAFWLSGMGFQSIDLASISNQTCSEGIVKPQWMIL
ncbi:phosphohydrolase [Methylocystaceae bacterium]|jgi:Icc-related predicted phosphoesterase|nr:phosphohydrolase [Methylocystaceae bacterium]